jgi:hypothetical protein
LKLRLERIISNEREAIKKIKEEGTKELEKAKAHFLYTEKNDFKKKEPKLIVKIKLEAAKMIEAKLQRLRDKHNDEIGKLKRDADLEIKNYKLELYRNMQHIYRKQRRSHDAVEKQLIDKLERELSSKLEDCREENRRELAILQRSHEQSSKFFRTSTRFFLLSFIFVYSLTCTPFFQFIPYVPNTNWIRSDICNNTRWTY